MIEVKEKEELWLRVSKEFPSDPMLRDLHFIRELMDAIERRLEEPKTIDEISYLVRKEFAEWLKIHPEFATKSKI